MKFQQHLPVNFLERCWSYYLWTLPVALSYSFNYSALLIVYDAHVKLVKYTCLVSFGRWIYSCDTKISECNYYWNVDNEKFLELCIVNGARYIYIVPVNIRSPEYYTLYICLVPICPYLDKT